MRKDKVIVDAQDYENIQGTYEDALYSGGSKLRSKYIRNRLTYEYEPEVCEDDIDFKDEIDISDEDVYRLCAELLLEFDENEHSV